MKETVTDINKPFADVFKALDQKTQRKAMKSAMRREGNRLKKSPIYARAAWDKAQNATCRRAYMCVRIPTATEWASW